MLVCSRSTCPPASLQILILKQFRNIRISIALGTLNKFLSRRVWVPFSRLSYCAYLVNGLVELHTIGTLRHPRYLTNLEMVSKHEHTSGYFLPHKSKSAPIIYSFFLQAKEISSHIFLTYALALLFSVLFEAPILSVESILLKKATNQGAKKPMGSSTVSVESQSSAETTTSNSGA